MNKEIKEILDYFKRDDKNKFGFNQAKLLNDDQAKQLLDYITNLQQENERLKEELEEEKKDFKEANDYAFKLLDYKSRCEKAVEYYKTHQQECVIGRNKDERLIKDYYLPAQCSKVLLNILQNGSEENE